MAFPLAASAQLIRPDSATATSEFSGSYVIANTINGSGLPAGFTLASTHATYAVNNHWTTVANHTLGESATFTFNAPQAIGVFHYWPHRSNGIAANPNYEATLYDLTFYDGPNGTGTTLAAYTNLPGAVDRDTVYSQPITALTAVRSVRYTIRQTQNNNASPYTGLAEVAFGACLAPDASQFTHPLSSRTCPTGSVTLTVVPFGTGPMSLRWQLETTPDTWIDANNGALPYNGGLITASGVTTDHLQLSLNTLPGAPALRFRCIVTNACGTAECTPATLTISCPNIADVAGLGGAPGCDGQNSVDDIVFYLDRFFAGDLAVADLVALGGGGNPDGQVTTDDLIAFLSAFFTGCP
ncbi:MAG: GC-type dockerin domain-anchored protein [Phycisphaerales bacterium]